MPCPAVRGKFWHLISALEAQVDVLNQDVAQAEANIASRVRSRARTSCRRSRRHRATITHNGSRTGGTGWPGLGGTTTYQVPIDLSWEGPRPHPAISKRMVMQASVRI